MSKKDFLKIFFKTPGNTGAIAPSSARLGDLMVKSAEVPTAKSILEFGIGTGIFTEKIQEAKSPEATFLAIEINPHFVEITQKRCPEAIIYQDDASNAKKYLTKHNIDECDCIISGLPWANFPPEMQQRILQGALDCLKPNGLFVTFAYLNGIVFPKGKAFYKLLQKNFSTVEKSQVVWLNVPPAFTYICRK